MKLKLAKQPKKVSSKILYSRIYANLPFLLLIIIYFISSLAFATPLNGDGYGKSENEARENALATLSQQILVDVDSSASAKVTEKNGTVDKSAETEVALESHIKFQGVVFEKAKRKRKTYHVRAILSDNALRQTILYLAENLPDDIDGLTRLQISDAYHEARQLRALFNFAAQQNLAIPGGNAIAKNAANVESELQLRLGNYGWVRFIPPVSVALNNNFTITIDEKNVATASKIYLPVGSFRYQITRDGYATEQGILRISRGREERTQLALVRLPKEAINVTIVVDAHDRNTSDVIMRALEEILLQYNIQIVKDSPLILNANADIQANTAVKDFEHLQVNLSLNFKRSGRTLTSSSQNIRLFDTEKIDVGQYQWQKLTEKTLIELLAGDGLVKVTSSDS